MVCAGSIIRLVFVSPQLLAIVSATMFG